MASARRLAHCAQRPPPNRTAMTPFRALLLLFLIIPVAEIYLLIKVGGLIGALPTAGLVVFTAVLGATLMRVQGFTTLERMREALDRGELPTLPLVEGVVLLVSGALLLTPGFITDVIGFLGLAPPLRRLFARWVVRRILQEKVGDQGGRGESRTLEGEFWRDDEP